MQSTEIKKIPSLCLLGAIAGDVIGSAYEFHPTKTTRFELFTARSEATDDSILTLAVADAILNKRSYRDCIQEYARAYPDRGYGGFFGQWIHLDDPRPYNSYGNGSAMRVSPVGWAFNSLDQVLREAEASAAVTHNHPEGIKGRRLWRWRSSWLAAGLARQTSAVKPSSVLATIYPLTLDEIRPAYQFDETCQKTVPPALIAFLESLDFEDAIRKAVSLGGDADTLAAITGSIAEAFYGGVPEGIIQQVKLRLPQELWRLVERFNRKVSRRHQPDMYEL